MSEILLTDDSKTKVSAETKPKTDLSEPIGKKVDLGGIDVSEIKKPEKKIQPVGQKSNGLNKELDELLGSYKEVPAPDFNSPDINPFSGNQDQEEKPKKRRRRKKAEPQIISGEIITGAMFLTLVDMFVPMVIGAVHNYLSKDKIKTNGLKLNQTQKNELEPIVNEVMKQWEIKANPAAILIISLVSIYGVNYLNLKSELD